MNPLEHLSDIDPLTNVQSDWSLPPATDCASLSDVLTLVEPRIGPALLDTAGRATLHHVASCISAHLSVFWGLEIRLGDSSPRADFLWEVVQDGCSILTLAGRNSYDPATGATGALRERSLFWRDLARFAEEWLDSADWRRRLGNIWLEVDSVAASSGEKLDVHLNRPNLFWGPNHQVTGSDRELLGHLSALGRRFYGLESDQAWIDAVADTIPEEGHVFQMGVMGARADPVTRLCVWGLDAGMQDRWLAAIGWPGDRARLRDTLVRLAPLCGETALNVDILPDRVGPRLGIEIYSAKPTFSMEAWRPLMEAWRPLHDELSAQGLARSDKLAALEDFPSFQRFRQRGIWRRIPPLGYPLLATNLHHLKLVFVGDTVIDAKAYLGVFRPVIDYFQTTEYGGNFMGGWGKGLPAHPDCCKKRGMLL